MGFLSKVVERKVSNVSAPDFNESERAKGLIAAIAGHCWAGKGDMVDRVFDAIRQHFPRASWTRRRVRALWHREAAGVRWGEMRQLEFVAEVERTRRQEQEQARSEHHEFIGRIGATLDRLAVSDAAFHREHMLALRGMAGEPAHRQIGALATEGSQYPAQIGEGPGL